MLLRDLTIENYRSFEKYRLNNLARVNLLVGDNNCGKTSVLEAVSLLIASDIPHVMSRLLAERGEIVSVHEHAETPHVKFSLGSAFFRRSGGDSAKSAEFCIKSENYGYSRVVHGAFDELRHNEPAAASLVMSEVDLAEQVFRGHSFAFFSEQAFYNSSDPSNVALIKSDSSGTLDYYGELTETLEWICEDPYDEFPLGYLSTRLPDSRTLLVESAALEKNNNEDLAINAVRILVPNLSDIRFLPSTARSDFSRVNVLFEIEGRRLPLSRFGEGVARALTLGIALGRTSGGVLLVDEIDTGLHYSRLADMWRMVIQTAKDLDVQVFATTHSQDCIRAFAEAVWREESLAPEIALHSIDRRMQESVRFGADELQVVVDQGIEVR